MTDLIKQLTELKNKFEQRKIAHAEAKGRLDELYRQLATNYSCRSKKEAEEYARELEEEKEQLEAEIEERLEKVSKELG